MHAGRGHVREAFRREAGWIITHRCGRVGRKRVGTVEDFIGAPFQGGWRARGSSAKPTAASASSGAKKGSGVTGLIGVR